MPFVAGESGGSGGEFKQFAAVASAVAACITILLGIKALTGINPLSALVHHSPSPTPTAFSPLCCTASPSVPVEPTSSEPDEFPSSEESAPTPEPADFIVISADWVGQCVSNSCTMSATFRNIGGDGTAVAIFHVIPNGGGADLARCSTVIPYTTAQGSASTECTATSTELAQYFATYGTVRMRVTVDNPY